MKTPKESAEDIYIAQISKLSLWSDLRTASDAL